MAEEPVPLSLLKVSSGAKTMDVLPSQRVAHSHTGWISCLSTIPACQGIIVLASTAVRSGKERQWRKMESGSILQD